MNQSLAHIRNRVAIFWSYAARRTIVRGGPKYVLLEATGKCNLFCPMCPRELVHFEPVDIPMPLFRKVIGEARDHLEFTVPYGAGEPLLNKRIFEMIRFCRERNIRIGISTNGTLNNAERNRMLLASGLDYLIFAFDGATKESYEKYRKGAKFEETREKILEFLRMKREMNSGIYTIVQMVRLKDNAGEVDAFRKMWNIPGVNQVRIKEDELQFDGVGIPRPKEVAKRRNPCHYLWQGPVYIHHDGNVFPCCYMWRGEPLGNANGERVADIWNNDKMQRLRKAHLSKNISAYPDCLNCHAPKPRLPVILGSFVINSLAVRKWIPVFEKLSLLFSVSVFERRAAKNPNAEADERKTGCRH